MVTDVPCSWSCMTAGTAVPYRTQSFWWLHPEPCAYHVIDKNTEAQTRNELDFLAQWTGKRTGKGLAYQAEELVRKRSAVTRVHWGSLVELLFTENIRPLRAVCQIMARHITYVISEMWSNCLPARAMKCIPRGAGGLFVYHFSFCGRLIFFFFWEREI